MHSRPPFTPLSAVSADELESRVVDALYRKVSPDAVEEAERALAELVRRAKDQVGSREALADV